MPAAVTAQIEAGELRPEIRDMLAPFLPDLASAPAPAFAAIAARVAGAFVGMPVGTAGPSVSVQGATRAAQAWQMATATLMMGDAPATKLDLALWEGLPARTVLGAAELLRAALEDWGTLALDLIGRLSAKNLTLGRTLAALLQRRYRDDYWLAHAFATALPKHRSDLRFRAVRFLLERFPAIVGTTAKIICETDPACGVDPALLDVLVDKADAQAQPDPGWGTYFLALALERGGRPRRAYGFLRQGYRSDSDNHLRFSNLELAAKLAGQFIGKRAELRFLVTALRVRPGHVGAKTMLSRIVELAKAFPEIGVGADPEAFYAGRTAILDQGGVVDIAEAMQARLQVGSRLQACERARPAAPRSVGTSAVVVIPSTLVPMQRMPSVRDLAADADSWELAFAEQHGTMRAAVRVAQLKNACLLTQDDTRAVFDAEGALLPEFSSGPASFFRFGKLLEGEVVEVQGKSFNNAIPYGHSNYSHFLLDRAPQLLFCEGMSGHTTVLVDEDALVWTQQLLEGAGITATLFPVRQRVLYRLEEVTMLTVPQHPLQTGYRGYIDFLRRLLPAGAALNRKRIVVHRPQGRRGLHNEAEFYACMEAFGFEIVRFEQHGIPGQLDLMRQAEIVVGIHGAGLSNVATCQPGAKLIEILPVGYHNPAFMITARAAGMSYWPYVENTAVNWQLATRQQFSDTLIDIDAWKYYLERVIAYRPES